MVQQQLAQIIAALADEQFTFPCGYADSHLGMQAAVEPTALATLACLALGLNEKAIDGGDWLAEIQQPSGFLGVGGLAPSDSDAGTTPRWPTSLALLAWCVLGQEEPPRYTDNVERASDALLTIEGEKIPPTPDLGHDTQLVGWPWVDGTHSWIEPTSLAVIGLKAAGHWEHPRVREAVALIRDRQIQGSGWNYGNTVVLGQTHAAHVQPTGLALLALIGEQDRNNRKDTAFRYLLRALQRGTGTTSLAWAWLGLAAHDRLPSTLENEVTVRFQQILKSDRSPFKLALLALAAMGVASPVLSHLLASRDRELIRVSRHTAGEVLHV